MVASLAVYLVLGSSAPIYYRMVFPFNEEAAGSHALLLDARKDLTAVGYRWANMIDVIPTFRICVVKGRSVEGSEQFWPLSITGESTLQGIAKGNPHYDRVDDRTPRVNAVVIDGKIKLRGKTRKVKSPGYCVPFDEPAFITHFKEGWWPNYKRQEDRVLDGRSVAARACTVRGVKVANLEYSPVTPGYETCMHDAEATAALIYVNDSYELLQSRVVNLGRADITEILWADKSGWLVVKAVDGERSGLAWLYPQE